MAEVDKMKYVFSKRYSYTTLLFFTVLAICCITVACHGDSGDLSEPIIHYQSSYDFASPDDFPAKTTAIIVSRDKECGYRCTHFLLKSTQQEFLEMSSFESDQWMISPVSMFGNWRTNFVNFDNSSQYQPVIEAVENSEQSKPHPQLLSEIQMEWHPEQDILAPILRLSFTKEIIDGDPISGRGVYTHTQRVGYTTPLLAGRNLFDFTSRADYIDNDGNIAIVDAKVSDLLSVAKFTASITPDTTVSYAMLEIISSSFSIGVDKFETAEINESLYEYAVGECCFTIHGSPDPANSEPALSISNDAYQCDGIQIGRIALQFKETVLDSAREQCASKREN